MPPGSSREGRSAETSSPQCLGSAGVLNDPPTPSRSLQHIGLGVGELFEAAPDALVTIDGDGEIALANAQVEHLFGYGRHELVGRPIEVLMPERFWQSHVGHRARYAATPVVRPMGTGLRLVCRRKDGTEFWAEISLSPIATGAGLVVTCAIRDVTERLNAEDERAALLAREQSARDAAAVRARDEFLCVAAHELKTPVTSLRGYAQLLLRQLRTQGVLDVKLTTRALNVIDQSSGRLEELVTRLLDVSRIQAGKLALDPRPTDVVPLVWRTVDAAQLRTTEHRLKVRAPASLLALIDPLRFEQVVSNLLDNAVKFSPPATRIDVVVSTDGPSVRLTVRDRGDGIRPEHRAQIFDSFRQAEQPDHLTRRRGIGLGLYVSREIVHLHGGCVDVQSPPGGGTRFVVTLPLHL